MVLVVSSWLEAVVPDCLRHVDHGQPHFVRYLDARREGAMLGHCRLLQRQHRGIVYVIRGDGCERVGACAHVAQRLIEPYARRPLPAPAHQFGGEAAAGVVIEDLLRAGHADRADGAAALGAELHVAAR